MLCDELCRMVSGTAQAGAAYWTSDTNLEIQETQLTSDRCAPDLFAETDTIEKPLPHCEDHICCCLVALLSLKQIFRPVWYAEIAAHGTFGEM